MPYIVIIVIREADKALNTLRKAQVTAPTRKRKAKNELNALFTSSKKGTSVVWKHTFVCLAYTDQLKIPTNETEKDDLLRCGLGEQVIEFSSLDLNANEFKELNMETFPKLSDGGGYMFFKCGVNSRNLEPLSEVCLASPRSFKDRVKTTRKTYIRPLQRDFDL